MSGQGKISGWLEGQEHLLAVRVYYEDTDAAGIVYYANYLRFAERARTEMLRLAGISQSEMRSAYGLGFVVRDCSLEYRKPARLDDILTIRSQVTSLGAASLRAQQAITRDDDCLARLDLRCACVDDGGHPVRIPPFLRQVLEPLTPPQERS